jgi:hypothetical protein
MKKLFSLLSLLMVFNLIGCHCKPCRNSDDDGKVVLQKCDTKCDNCKCDLGCSCSLCQKV